MVNFFPIFYISDIIVYFKCSTPVFTGDGEGGSGFVAAAAAAAASGGDTGFDFGVDPNIDPELALALRVSLEEERARQEAAAKRAAEETSRQEKGEEPSSNAEDATMEEHVNVTAPEDIKKVTEEKVGVFFLISILDICVCAHVNKENY